MKVSLRVAATAAVVAVLLFVCRAEGSSRSAEPTYDSNKGVFSPQGRLVQLDYVEGLVKRGNLCMGVECKDGVVLMTDKLVFAGAAELLVDGGVRHIYRVDSHIALLPAGLPADGRALAHKAMDYCRSHRREYGEPIPGRLLATRLGEFLHAACVRWGSRAYPNALFIACWGGTGGTPEGFCSPLRSGGNKSGAGAGGGVVKPEAIVSGATTAALGEPPAAAAAEAQSLGVKERNLFGGEAERDQEVVEGKRQGTTEEEEEGGKEDEKEEDCEGIKDWDTGFQLYLVDPSGASRRHRAAATGRGSSLARKWLLRRALATAAPAGVARQQEGGATRTGGVVEDIAAAPRSEEEKGRDRQPSPNEPPSAARETERADGREQEQEEEAGGGDDIEDTFDEELNSDDGGAHNDEENKDCDDDQDDYDNDRLSTVRTPGAPHFGDWHRQGRRRHRQRRRRRQGELPFSQMTCAEAARALVGEARRARAGELGEAGAAGDGGLGRADVASLPEVAWLTIDGKTGRDGEGQEEALFVHHRSMRKLLASGR